MKEGWREGRKKDLWNRLWHTWINSRPKSVSSNILLLTVYVWLVACSCQLFFQAWNSFCLTLSFGEGRKRVKVERLRILKKTTKARVSAQWSEAIKQTAKKWQWNWESEGSKWHETESHQLKASQRPYGDANRPDTKPETAANPSETSSSLNLYDRQSIITTYRIYRSYYELVHKVLQHWWQLKLSGFNLSNAIFVRCYYSINMM